MQVHKINVSGNLNRWNQITLPEDSRFLSAANQHGVAVAWYLNGLSIQNKTFNYILMHTGKDVPPINGRLPTISNLKLINTLVFDDGDYILHMFVLDE